MLLAASSLIFILCLSTTSGQDWNREDVSSSLKSWLKEASEAFEHDQVEEASSEVKQM